MTERTLDDIITGPPNKFELVEEPKGEPEKVEPEKAAPPVADEKPPPKHVPQEALFAERKQRQELDRQLKSLQTEMADLKKPKPEKVGLLDDPDKWEEQLNQRIESAKAEVRQEAQANYLRLLERQARERHKDDKITWDDASQVFADAARDNAALIAETLQADDPAEYIYQAGRKLKMLAEAGDLDALLEKTRQEARDEALSSEKSEVPESLTDVTGAKGKTQTWKPKPLEAILKPS